MNQPKNLVQKAGFTLIELSIVLVIIGLIVGGVLVGQDLIKAAEIRATIAQIEKYNSAVNTFQGKYNAKPGDITGTLTGQAAQFGLYVDTSGTAGHGDGNGLIEGEYTGGAPTTRPIGEPLTFWRHLYDANLVDGSYGLVGNSSLNSAPGVNSGTGIVATSPVTNMQQSIPVAKLGPAGSIIVYSTQGLNYYQIVPITNITGTAAAVYTLGGTGLTPVQGNNMDTKLDDGAPNTGIVTAKGINGQFLPVTVPNGNPSWIATSTTGYCIIGGTSATDQIATYNRVAATGGNDPTCSLRIRHQ